MKQRGLVTQAQLVRTGLTRGAVAHRVKMGRLHPVHRGVYLVGDRAAPPLAAEAAAILTCGRDALLGCHTAAALWGWRASLPPTIDVVVVGRNPGARTGVRVHRVRRMDDADRARRHGLPLTAPARTLLDQAAVLASRDLERAIDEAMTTRRVTPSLLKSTLQRAPNHRGGRAMRAYLEAGDEPHMTISEAEERMLALVRAADLPRFETNRKAVGYRVDFLWRAQRVVVEVDSWQFHRDRRRFEGDRRRDADLQAAGYAILRITARRLRHEPLFVAARLAATLTRRLQDADDH